VTGFTISGQVLSYTDPMSNVNVYLYKANDNIEQSGKGALQSTETDGQGTYKFANIPSGGSYKIAAHYSGNLKEGQTSKFSIEPEVI
jgi:hypothetical protein